MEGEYGLLGFLLGMGLTWLRGGRDGFWLGIWATFGRDLGQ